MYEKGKGRKMKALKVLVTGCGGIYTGCLIESLRMNDEREIFIIGTDVDRKCYSRNSLDRFYEVVEFNNPKYGEMILDICKKEKVDVVIPTASAELKALARLKYDFLRAGTKLIISNDKSLDILLDKLNSTAYFKLNGYLCRKHMVVTCKDDLDRAKVYMGTPYVVKAAYGSGSKGVRIVDDNIDPQQLFFDSKPGIVVTSEQLKSTLHDKFPPLLVDTYVKGVEYSVDLVANNGEVVAMCGRLNPIINNSIPMYSKVSVNEEAFAICRSLVKHLKLNGNIDVDFIIDEKGNAELLEVNPRIGATTGFFTSAGVNLPYISIKVALGEDISDMNTNPLPLSMKRAYSEHYFWEVEDA